MDQEENIDMWEEDNFSWLNYSASGKSDPEPEDWNCKFDKILLIKFKEYI